MWLIVSHRGLLVQVGEVLCVSEAHLELLGRELEYVFSSLSNRLTCQMFVSGYQIRQTSALIVPDESEVSVDAVCCPCGRTRPSAASPCTPAVCLPLGAVFVERGLLETPGKPELKARAGTCLTDLSPALLVLLWIFVITAVPHNRACLCWFWPLLEIRLYLA